MSKKMTSLFAAAGFAVISTGCSTTFTHVSKQSVPAANIVAKTAYITPDLEFGERIKGTATLRRGFFGGYSGSTKYADGISYMSNLELQDTTEYESFSEFSEAKAAAAYDACQKSGADILCFPSYILSVKHVMWWSTIHCEVSGFKGVIKGIKGVEFKGDTNVDLQLKLDTAK